MNEDKIKLEYASQKLELQRLIYGWDLIPNVDKNDFSHLANHILKVLWEGIDFHRVKRILSSELVTRYGLDVLNPDRIDRFTEDVENWWFNRNHTAF